MPNVVIVGAGLAGLSASLRLLERGFRVTLIEQDDFVGGMLGAYRGCGKAKATDLYHEHSYHMFMNWYYNFWQIADEIGVIGNFAPRTTFKFLRRGQFPHLTELVNPGGISHARQNLRSGVVSMPEMFLYMYSLIDLLSQPIKTGDFTDYYSVNGFMRSRMYNTRTVAELQQKVWETVWAIPSFDSSAASYKTFLKYGNRVPNPQLWLLKGNKEQYLMQPFLKKLEASKHFKLLPLSRVTGLQLTRGRISTIQYQRVDKSPSRCPGAWKPVGPPKSLAVEDELLLAVTPKALTTLVTADLYNADPALGDVRYLESMEMAAVELHFTKKLEEVPSDVTVLLGADAKYQMTFLDYSQIWPDLDHTLLYVTVSDYTSLAALPPEQRRRGRLLLNLAKPRTAVDYILRELGKFLPFVDETIIDLERTGLKINVGEELFANEVGSWQYRPGATTRIPNLFLAGTFCRNHADVATIEGAVVTGLLAAESIRAKHKAGDPIEIIEPETYPESFYLALKLLWAPYAFMAKAWASTNNAFGNDGPEPD